MLIAVISDTHDNIPNLEKFLGWAKENKVEAIIHCGDIAAPATVAKVIAPNFAGQIHLVYGNAADSDGLKRATADLKNVTIHGDSGIINLAGKDIAFCHFPEEAKKMAETGHFDFVFYGHTHKPWIESVGRTVLANPGTLAGLFQKATFAIYDTTTNNLELKILELI